MLRFALVRAIEIIGEAAARVSTDVRHSELSIPWSEAVGIRNRLIPALLKALHARLSARSDGPSA